MFGTCHSGQLVAGTIVWTGDPATARTGFGFSDYRGDGVSAAQPLESRRSPRLGVGRGRSGTPEEILPFDSRRTPPRGRHGPDLVPLLGQPQPAAEPRAQRG